MEQSAPPDVPADVQDILQTLWSNGHAAYLVGGGVRDSLLRRPVTDWDIATDALPERTLSLFPGSQYKNRFGTVTIGRSTPIAEVTTFRRDHRYADHRRPDSVTFTDSLEEDLARRDFTVNAIAWGRGAADADADGALGRSDRWDGRPSGRRCYALSASRRFDLTRMRFASCAQHVWPLSWASRSSRRRWRRWRPRPRRRNGCLPSESATSCAR